MGDGRPSDANPFDLGSSELEAVRGAVFPPAPHPPPQIPDHEILRRVGIGAYGEVWLARNTTGSYRAVKVVHRSSFDSDRPYQREFGGIKKFEPISHARESQVDIFHVGLNEPGGYFYYIMELADPAMPNQEDAKGQRKDGEGQKATVHPPSAVLDPSSYVPRTLKHDLKTRGALAFDECLRIGLALTGALEHLHGHGLVHRDIKPSNIIFVNGVPKLADIGLVTSIDATRSYVGTEGYVSPEGPGTPQADLFSLGKVLYEMVTGGDRENFPALPAGWRGHAEYPRLLELNEIILKACDHDPRQRYQTAREMQEELALLQRGRSIQKRRRWQQVRSVAGKAGVGLAVLGLAALLVGELARRRVSSPMGAGERASIFVLPFRFPGTNAYLTANWCENTRRCRLTDAFRDSLAQVSGVRVGPKKSAWIFRDEAELRREVGPAFRVQ